LANTLINQVIQFQQQGYDDNQIAAAMAEQGIAPNQIVDAINKSKIKAAVYQEPAAEAGYPAPDQYGQQMAQQQMPMQQSPQEYVQGMSSETVSEIADQIISEKLSDVTKAISKVTSSKEAVDKRLALLEEKTSKVESIIEELRSAIIRKIGEYGQNLEDIKGEMGMMQDTFSKALKPSAESKKSRPKEETSEEKEREPAKSEPEEDSFLERRLNK